MNEPKDTQFCDIQPSLDKARTDFIEDQKMQIYYPETRFNLLRAIGDTAILAFYENDEFFKGFIQWLQDSRKIAQQNMEESNET